MVAAAARGQKQFFARYILLQLQRLQLGLVLTDRVVFRGQTLGQGTALPGRVFELAFELDDRGGQRGRELLELFGWALPAGKLGERGCALPFRLCEFTASFHKATVEVPRLPRLADRAT